MHKIGVWHKKKGSVSQHSTLLDFQGTAGYFIYVGTFIRCQQAGYESTLFPHIRSARIPAGLPFAISPSKSIEKIEFLNAVGRQPSDPPKPILDYENARRDIPEPLNNYQTSCSGHVL